MGYSCAQKASKTLESLIKTLRVDDKTPTNHWEHDGISYFYEIGRENYDYSITGSVFRINKGSITAVRAGSFKISRDGILVRWPAISAHLRKMFR